MQVLSAVMAIWSSLLQQLTTFCNEMMPLLISANYCNCYSSARNSNFKY